MSEPYRAQKYQSVEGSLGGGATNSQISLGQLTEAIYCQIANDDNTNSFTVKFNGVNNTTNPAYTVKAGERVNLSDVGITSIYFTNRSGSAIAYRVMLWGD